MIKSMTAFDSIEKIFDGFSVFLEIRSYNSRYLDISLNIPHEIKQFEERIKSLIIEKVNRGRVELKIKFDEEKDSGGSFELDMDRAKSYSDIMSQLKDELDIDVTVSIDFLSGAGRVLLPADSPRDVDTIWNGIEKCCLEAIDNLDTMRRKEGLIISQDLTKRLDYIESLLNQIKKMSENLLALYQDRLKKRIEDLTKGIVEIDIERITQEAAFLADKSDITEELLRAESHIKQFRAIQESDEPAGRKINFLLQELGREFNTIGSKTGKADVAHIVVDIKSELEKMREQIQNVE